MLRKKVFLSRCWLLRCEHEAVPVGFRVGLAESLVESWQGFGSIRQRFWKVFPKSRAGTKKESVSFSLFAVKVRPWDGFVIVSGRFMWLEVYKYVLFK